MAICVNPYCQHTENPDTNNWCNHCGSGLLLANRYLAIKQIGQGGFGRTFLAIDKGSIIEKEKCLVKQFYINNQSSQQTVPFNQQINKRGITFIDQPGVIQIEDIHRKEIAALSKLKHPQIPKYIDQFTQDEYLYIVQEFIDGENLSRELSRHGKFSEQQVTDIIKDVINVLDYVHCENIIHRDIKPDNLIRDKNKKIVLVDFGAAKLVIQNKAQQAVYQTLATPVGTLDYMAPEQSKGRATYASDLYSLGITCIHLLTGKPLNELSNDATNTWEWKPFCKSVNPNLAEIIDKLIELGTNKRYQSAKDVITDLNNLNNIRKDTLETCAKSETKTVSSHIQHLPNWLTSFGTLIGGFGTFLAVLVSIGIFKSCNTNLPLPEQLLPTIDRISDSLKKSDWKSADNDTYEMLLSFAGAEAQSRGFILPSEISKISCDNVRKIDGIWRDHSNGQQGFSAQQLIYESSGYSWQKAYEKFGWGKLKNGVINKNIEQVLDYKKRRLQYHSGKEPNFKTPQPGHLPITMNLVQGTAFPQLSKICK